MEKQTLKRETLPTLEERPTTFPRYRAKCISPTIRKPDGESKREANKPYYRGGPRINSKLLRRLDILSRAYHRNRQDLLKRGVCLSRLEEVEWEIVHNRGGIFDDR